MKIAVSGKGGTGKTTIAGTIARLWTRAGRRVLAIDADPNPNMSVILGLPRDQAFDLTPIPRNMAEWREDPGGRAYVHLHLPVAEIERLYGIPTPDNVTLLVTGRIEQAGVGCMCDPHAIARGLIMRVNAEADDVVTDMEAGLEHLSRGTVEYVDALLIVVEPYYRSLETGARAHDLAAQLGVPRLYAVANKVRTDNERQAIADFCARHEMELVAAIPYDETMPQADQLGLSPLELAPNAPAIQAIRALADDLEHRVNTRSNSNE
ncbi:MAG: AAA family ATPase [Anaerolineae bacterium]